MTVDITTIDKEYQHALIRWYDKIAEEQLAWFVEHYRSVPYRTLFKRSINNQGE